MVTPVKPAPSRHGLGRLAFVASLAAIALSGVVPAAAQSPASLGAVTIGSNYSDPVPKAAFQAMVDYCAAQTGTTVTVNTTEHGKFQDNLTSYLQGTPDDIFTWFAGYRMRYFADQGLLTPIDDVWAKVGSNYSDAFKAASTGNDGKGYFIPLYNYPWVVLYRKSVFESKGYTVPKTWDEFTTLMAKMKTDGLIPVAFGDFDGWPAMGTFDILNMRLNGYQFHVDLMAGKEKWTDPRVKAVFEAWKTLLPNYSDGGVGQKWQDASTQLVQGKAGMMFLGTFAGQTAQGTDAEGDLAFFPFPTMGTAFDAEMGIDAPIDGLLLSKAPKNLEGAKALMECFSTGAAQLIYLAADPNSVAAANDADTSGYTDFQKASAAIIGSAGAIAQFLDRDTIPAFAGATGMQPQLQSFIGSPDQDLDAYLQGIQDLWDGIASEQ
jgi:multiple sugar transport system substrate-binding protein